MYRLPLVWGGTNRVTRKAKHVATGPVHDERKVEAANAKRAARKAKRQHLALPKLHSLSDESVEAGTYRYGPYVAEVTKPDSPDRLRIELSLCGEYVALVVTTWGQTAHTFERQVTGRLGEWLPGAPSL